MAATRVTDVAGAGARRRRVAAPEARRPGGQRRYSRKVRDNTSAYVFLIGGVFCFALFSWYPMIREVVMSFQKTNFAGETTWVGLQNYRHIVLTPASGARGGPPLCSPGWPWCSGTPSRS